MLRAEGHEITFLTGSVFRDRIEDSGAKFVSLPPGADFDGRDILSGAPELKNIRRDSNGSGLLSNDSSSITSRHSTGACYRRYRNIGPTLSLATICSLASCRCCLDRNQSNLPSFSAVHRFPRAPFLACRLHNRAGAAYADIAREFDEGVDQPALLRLNKELSSFDVGPLTAPLFHSVVELADAYMQLSVPRFDIHPPPSVHFVGAPSIVPGQAPPPPWAHDLDGSHKIVLVTQGTVANHNFAY